MRTIRSYLVDALLADAAYADSLSDNLSGAILADKLKPRMTSILAQFLGERFIILSHIESGDVLESGFDATVWKGRAGSEYAGKVYVSFQGTRGLQDFMSDAQLTLSSLAGRQIVDMVNWWLRCTTPAGVTTRQFLELGGRMLPAASVPGQGLVSVDDLTTGVEVNGHSLGGYLATAFTRLFGTQANVLHTTTFNSAGFAPGSELAFSRIESALGPGYGRGALPGAGDPAQTNVFAANGLNLTSNSLWFNQVGQRVALFNEEGKVGS